MKYHGGKYYLCEWIISHFTDHTVYVEPFGGAASVLLNKPTSQIEVYNDLDAKIATLLKVVKENCEIFLQEIKKLKYEKEQYLALKTIYRSKNFLALPDIEQAITSYAVKRMSRGGLCGTFSWSKRISLDGTPSEANAWNTMLEEIPIISNRLTNVVMLNCDALKVIEQYDSPNTLFYLDPPYPKETRVFQNAYNKEMTEFDHKELGQILRSIQGKAIISSYPSTLYDDLFQGWRQENRLIPNHSSHEKKKELKQERLWLNYNR